MYDSIRHIGGVWGWRGILGQIAPSVFSLLGEYFYQVVPEGVGLMVVTLGVDDPTSQAELERALSETDQAAKRLAQAGPNYICLSGEALTLSQGFGFDEKIIKRIEAITGIPTTTSLTAVIEAFRALSIKKLVMAGPGTEKANTRKKDFLEANGFQVLHFRGPEVVKNSDRARLPMHVPYIEGKKAYLAAPEADAIYLSCGAWRAGPAVIELLEKDTGKPVITPPQAFIWAGLKALKIREPVKGFGKLFETL